jgi:putative FmdB family regulatory protein
MPIYEYKCLHCGQETQCRNTLSEFRDIISCPKCAGDAKIQISLGGQTNFGFVPFVTDHITGEPINITSRQQKKALLKEHNLSEAG